MKTTVSKHGFRQAFSDAGRSEQFNHEALDMLFEYFEQLENDTGEEIELDVVAICCEYAEDTVDEITNSYRIDLDDCDDDDEKMDAVRSFLEKNTFLVGETPDGFVYAQF